MFVHRCVCASNSPGKTVEDDKSITVTFEGIARLAPTAWIFPFSTRMVLIGGRPSRFGVDQPARLDGNDL
jgi:hypothetical protein